MQSSQVFNKKYKVHTDKTVCIVCTVPSCSQRVLCLSCLSQHNPSHQSSFHALADLLSYDMDSDFQLIEKKIQTAATWKVEQEKQLEKVFEALKVRFFEALEESKKIVQSKLNERFGPSPDLSKEFEVSKERYQAAKKELSQFQGENPDEIEKIIEEMASSYGSLLNVQTKVISSSEIFSTLDIPGNMAEEFPVNKTFCSWTKGLCSFLGADGKEIQWNKEFEESKGLLKSFEKSIFG